MAPSAVATWKACVKDLQTMSQLPSNDPRLEACYTTLDVYSSTLEQLPPLPKATWRKLVQELQIPLQLCRLSAEAAQQDCSSIAATAAVEAATTFLILASRQGVIGGAANSSSLATALQQQVEQSGLLQQLPHLMSAAAEQLAAHTGSSSSADSVGGPVSELPHSTAESRAGALLQLFSSTDPRDGAPESLGVVFSAGPAALQLIRAAMQYVSRQLQHQQEAGDVPAALRPLALSCCLVASRIMEPTAPINDSSSEWLAMPEAAALAHSPDAVPCLALLAAVGTFAATGKWKRPQGDTGSSGSSGGGSSSSSSTAATQAAAAWQQVGANLRSVTPCHEKLFGLLGVDSRAVLWTAGMLWQHTADDSSGTHAGASVLQMAAAFISRHAAAVTARPEQPQHAAQLQLQQQLHMLLPSLWLHWGSKLVKGLGKTGSRGRAAATQAQAGSVLQGFAQAAGGSADSLRLWLDSTQQARTSQQQQAAGGGGNVADPWLQPKLPPALLAELLPQVLKQLGVLLQWCASTTEPQAAGVAAAASASSSSNSSSTLSQSAVQQLAVSGYLQLLCLLLRHSQAPGSLEAAAAARSAVLPQCVQDSLPTILQLLDSGVRYLASHWGCTSSSDVLMMVTTWTDFFSSSVQDGSAGGRQQVQLLYSLLSSLLKLGSVYAALPPGLSGNCAGKCLSTVVRAVSSLLAAGARTSSNAAPDPAAGVSGDSGSSSSTTVQPQQSEADAQASSVSVLLPSLQLLGRCCLQLAQQLQAVECSSDNAKATEEAGGSIDGLNIKDSVLLAQASLMRPFMQWLSLPGVAQQLSAAGYQPEQLQQSLQDLSVALGTAAATAAETGSRGPQPTTALVEQLTAAGHTLCSVAVPEMCNNPACVNLSGPSDIALVSGRSCLCAGCVTARYCGRACQVAHWKVHKPVCAALKAAAAATAAATAPTAAAAVDGGPQAV